jgi:hypothetical protein
VATVPSVSSRPGHGLSPVPLSHGPKVATSHPVPSARPASVQAAPADSTSPPAASVSPALASPVLADQARADRAPIASPPATGRQPAEIVPTVRLPHAQLSRQGNVLLVRQAQAQLPAGANPAASENQLVPASLSENRAPLEQGRVAPRPQQVPASRAVPVALANPAHLANRAVARPPRQASVTSSHAASPRLPNVRPRNVRAASQLPNANRAAKETKAS